MVSIKELRSRNKADTIKRRVIPGRPILDQAISQANSTRGLSDVRPGPGLKQQAKKWKLNKFTMDEDVYVEDKS